MLYSVLTIFITSSGTEIHTSLDDLFDFKRKIQSIRHAYIYMRTV